ncbi:hypothetical protein CCP2SC5_130046 [Azospirillaceae bacterium]
MRFRVVGVSGRPNVFTQSVSTRFVPGRWVAWRLRPVNDNPVPRRQRLKQGAVLVGLLVAATALLMM